MIEFGEFNKFIDALVRANPTVDRAAIEQLMEDFGDRYTVEDGLVTFPGGTVLIDPDA